MKVEALRTFQLSGAPPHLCGEVFTISNSVGRRLIHQGVVKEIIEKPRRRRRRRKKRDEGQGSNPLPRC